MNCQKCDTPMEKAAKSGIFICRECGSTIDPTSKEQLRDQIGTLAKRIDALEGKKKEKGKGNGDEKDEW